MAESTAAGNRYMTLGESAASGKRPTAATQVATAATGGVRMQHTDMGEAMRTTALTAAREVVRRRLDQRRAAELVKKRFDAAYGANWHCIVGSHFGSCVTHEANGYCYLFAAGLALVVFKSF